MPLLIGDIGGSSSRWAMVAGVRTHIWQDRFPGFNPLTGDPLPLQQQLREVISPHLPKDVGALEVMAYGAGCGAPARAQRLRDALLAVWPDARILVGTDLLGAAHGLYGNSSGVVLILGTGMNAGYYDGAQVHARMPSLGYILGDEGSGADIGKHALHDALYGLMPAPVLADMLPGGSGLPDILQAVYRSTGAQAYVASFTGALARHVGEPYVQGLVASRFDALARVLQRFHPPPELGEVRATGSVAHGFRNLLQEVFSRHGIRVKGVEQDPLQGLVAFHAQQRG